MDPSGVPKKVLRHVLKAMRALSGEDTERYVNTQDIIAEVKFQMRNLVPVQNVEACIRYSLNSFCYNGVIQKQEGTEAYKLGQASVDNMPSTSGSVVGPIVIKPIEKKVPTKLPKVVVTKATPTPNHRYNLRPRLNRSQEAVRPRTQKPTTVPAPTVPAPTVPAPTVPTPTVPAPNVPAPFPSIIDFSDSDLDDSDYNPPSRSTGRTTRSSTSATTSSSSDCENNDIKTPQQCAQQ